MQKDMETDRFLVGIYFSRIIENCQQLFLMLAYYNKQCVLYEQLIWFLETTVETRLLSGKGSRHFHSYNKKIYESEKLIKPNCLPAQSDTKDGSEPNWVYASIYTEFLFFVILFLLP